LREAKRDQFVMSAETAFYIIGIALAVTAVITSVIGLRFQDFPPNRAALLGGVAVFVVLVGGATTFAWVNAEDEQEVRDEEIAAGELPAPSEANERLAAEAQKANELNEGEGAPAQEEETAAGTADGADLFDSQGCASCHTLKAANATGTVGPDLDAELAGADVAFIEESIVDPEAKPTKGFPAGVMPANFAEVLSPAELDALVQFIAESVGAKQ
jgi:mono/diheme cytochrome c family protein